MRKFYIIILLVAFTSYAFAQQKVASDVKIKVDASQIELLNSSKTPTDTLVPYGIANASGLYVTPSSSGYVAGTNDYGDLAKAQVFPVTAGYYVEGCLVWVGAKNIIGTAGTVSLNYYKMDNTGTSTAGANVAAPGTIVSSVSLDMDTDIDTAGGFSGALFSSPILSTSDYAVGLDFASIGDDTIGIVHSDDGDPQAELSWEKWSDNEWYTLKAPSSWGFDIDMAFLPIVDMSTQNINEQQFVNGVRMQAYPNPAVDYLNIDYQIEKEADVKIMVLDMSGKIVMTENLGQKATGMHNTTISTEELNSGVYFYVLEAGSQRLAKKVIVK